MYKLLYVMLVVVVPVLSEVCQHRDITYLQKLQREVQQNTLHDSFYMYMDPEFDNIKTFKDVPEVYKKTKSLLFPNIRGSERRCPREEEDVKVCPHYLEMQYDENRIPNIIIQARCRCKHCLHNSRKHRSRCVPMEYFTRVYRVTGCDIDTGFYTYQEVWEPVSVGCQCQILPRVISSE